jgi:hypothetical protein
MNISEARLTCEHGTLTKLLKRVDWGMVYAMGDV